MTPTAPPGRPAAEPIGPDWKMSQVLERYPALVETLAGLYPGFARLRNPVLRALRAPRLNVAQAARVAGLEPAALCRALNDAAGVPATVPPSPSPAPPAASGDGAPPALNGGPRLSEIDVSDLPPPEPMVRILEALAGLPPGGALHVRHARVPLYLYPRLDAMGCRHETTEVGPGHVELLITKPENAKAAPA